MVFHDSHISSGIFLCPRFQLTFFFLFATGAGDPQRRNRQENIFFRTLISTTYPTLKNLLGRLQFSFFFLFFFVKKFHLSVNCFFFAFIFLNAAQEYFSVNLYHILSFSYLSYLHFVSKSIHRMKKQSTKTNGNKVRTKGQGIGG